MYGYVLSGGLWFPTSPDAPDWWTTKSVDHPFQAQTPLDVTINPRMVDENVYGSFIYKKTDKGQMWGFKTVEARDAFCRKYGGVAL